MRLLLYRFAEEDSKLMNSLRIKSSCICYVVLSQTTTPKVNMKLTSALILALFTCIIVTAKPITWSARPPAGLFAARAEADFNLASSSISSDPVSFAKASYDYIIVGGGTAGLALASRLSESGEYTVGVLEAGISGLGVPIIDIPGYFGADVGTIFDCM